MAVEKLDSTGYAPSYGPASLSRPRLLTLSPRALVTEHGQPIVIHRVREHKIREEQEGMRSWIMLTVWASRERQRSGTI